MSHECCFRLVIKNDPDKEEARQIEVGLYGRSNLVAQAFGSSLSGALYELGIRIEKQINRDALSGWLQRGVDP